MQRVLEPEVMDTTEEAVDYDSMDHGEVNRGFVADFLSLWDQAEPVLDVGTGTAQIPVELCRQYRPIAVVAIDMAKEMLKVGRENVQRAGLESSIELQLCDAKKMPFGNGSFGAVISNSIVHHIPRPESVLGEIARVVKAGGAIFVRDLLRPESESEVERLVSLYAGECNAHQQQMFGDSLRAALTLAEIRQMVTDLGFDQSSVQQTTDRHWTWSAKKAE